MAGTLLLTASGAVVDLANITADDIDLRCATGALAKQDLFNGQGTHFVSRAHFAYMVASYMSPGRRIHALLASLPHAYTGCLNAAALAALQAMRPQDEQNELYRRLQQAIFTAGGVKWPVDPAIVDEYRKVQAHVLAAFRRDFLPAVADKTQDPYAGLPVSKMRALTAHPYSMAESMMWQMLESDLPFNLRAQYGAYA